MRNKKYYVYLEDDEYKQIVESVVRLRNTLIAQGKYTDAVDELLCKLIELKKRPFKIQYV